MPMASGLKSAKTGKRACRSLRTARASTVWAGAVFCSVVMIRMRVPGNGNANYTGNSANAVLFEPVEQALPSVGRRFGPETRAIIGVEGVRSVGVDMDLRSAVALRQGAA